MEPQSETKEGAPETSGLAGVPGKFPMLPTRSWGAPLLAADAAWTRFEIALATLVFVLEVLSMSMWVGLKGFSTRADTPGGLEFRAIVGGVVLGTLAHVVAARQPTRVRNGITLGAVLVGFATAKLWKDFGVDYASNLLNWYQQASFLTLLGGLRGVGTRLTMLLALIGGSLATARGRHIVIDIATRFVTPRTRIMMALVTWVTSAVVCIVAAWGFFDHISIEDFEARADDTAGGKISQVAHRLGEDFFIARKQLELDLMSTPHVLLRGETYSEWLGAEQWNSWLDSSGIAERYGKEGTEALRLPPGETRSPLIVIPGMGEPRGELISAGYLVFPIGLLIIGIRILLRGLLVMSGQVNLESDESEDWGDGGGHIEEGEA